MRPSVSMLLLALAFSAPSAADECPDMRESNSPVCSEILEKKLFENTVSFTENGQKYTYVKEPYTYVFTDARVDPEPTNPEIIRFGKASKQSVAIDAFPNCFYVTPELFEYDGDLYVVYPNRNFNLVYPGTNEIAVFKFDNDKFKGICHFKRTFAKTVLERGKKLPLCQKILDKKYTKSVSEPLQNLMTDDEMQKSFFANPFGRRPVSNPAPRLSGNADGLQQRRKNGTVNRHGVRYGMLQPFLRRIRFLYRRGRKAGVQSLHSRNAHDSRYYQRRFARSTAVPRRLRYV